jgi:inward rectifier potassium channel
MSAVWHRWLVPEVKQQMAPTAQNASMPQATFPGPASAGTVSGADDELHAAATSAITTRVTPAPRAGIIRGMAEPEPTRFLPEMAVRVGLVRRPLGDLYHFFMNCSWRTMLAIIVGGYVALNLIFALIYLALGPEGIEHARPGSFADAFFFSVQTMATIGYGKLVPASAAANILVTVEALVGLLTVTLSTGLIFAKFARPTARVMFSRIAVIGEYEGVPSLMFRMANERRNQIVEANLRVTLLRDAETREGNKVRRMQDLHLLRATSPMFALTWTAIHPLDERSPLAGVTADGLAQMNALVVGSLIGYDETFSQTVHARHTYLARDVRWNARFADILTRRPDGRAQIDYSRFDEITAISAP